MMDMKMVDASILTFSNNLTTISKLRSTRLSHSLTVRSTAKSEAENFNIIFIPNCDLWYIVEEWKRLVLLSAPPFLGIQLGDSPSACHSANGSSVVSQRGGVNRSPFNKHLVFVFVCVFVFVFVFVSTTFVFAWLSYKPTMCLSARYQSGTSQVH